MTATKFIIFNGNFFNLVKRYVTSCFLHYCFSEDSMSLERGDSTSPLNTSYDKVSSSNSVDVLVIMWCVWHSLTWTPFVVKPFSDHLGVKLCSNSFLFKLKYALSFKTDMNKMLLFIFSEMKNIYEIDFVIRS